MIEELEINYDYILNVNDTLYNSINSNGYVTYVYYREDTLTKKVYHRPSENSPEKLLYDFSLQEGDSINYPYFGQPRWFKIDSVINNEIFGVTRKIWYLRSPNNTSYPVWIEGIGSLSIIFHPIEEPSLDWMFFGLITCCYHDDNLIYQSYYGATYGCSFELLDIADLTNNLKVRIYPNPITNKSIIDISNLNNRTATVSIYNIIGNNIINFQTTQNTIQLNNFIIKQGIYFVNIQINNYSLTKKIIKL